MRFADFVDHHLPRDVPGAKGKWIRAKQLATPVNGGNFHLRGAGHGDRDLTEILTMGQVLLREPNMGITTLKWLFAEIRKWLASQPEPVKWPIIKEVERLYEIEAAAKDLCALWAEQKIAGLPRAERNAAIETARRRLHEACGVPMPEEGA